MEYMGRKEEIELTIYYFVLGLGGEFTATGILYDFCYVQNHLHTSEMWLVTTRCFLDTMVLPIATVLLVYIYGI